MTAMTIIASWSASPTAVMTESIEEHDVHGGDGDDGLRKPHALVRGSTRCLDPAGIGAGLANLRDALVDEVSAADEQDDVAHREPMREGAGRELEERGGHVYQRRGEQQQGDTSRKRAGQAEATAEMLFVLGKPLAGDADENEVVDTKRELEEQKRGESHP